MSQPIYEEEINGFLFREFGDIGRPRFLIIGLPDVGLVGSISAIHIAKSLNMEYKVGIDSYTALPPLVVIDKGSPLHPIRIYSRDEVAVLVTDVPIAPPALTAFSTAIVEYARIKGIKYLLSLTGIGNPMRFQIERPSVYWLASDREASLLAGELPEAKVPQQGILVGPYAIILKEASRKRVHNLVVLVDAFIDIPDPEAAARAVEAAASIIKVRINVEDLLKQAEEIKLRMKELMNETRNLMARLGKGMEYRAPVLYT